MPDAYRPTLYDFLAERRPVVLHFRRASRRPRPRMLSSCRPIARSFPPIDEFLAWDIKTTDETSATVKALHLYQDLLKFHQADKDPTRVARRRSGAAQLRQQPCVRRREERTLQSRAEKIRRQACRSRTLGHGPLAMGDRLANRKEAWSMRTRSPRKGEKAFPNSLGGKLCHNIVVADRSQEHSGHHRTGLERSLADARRDIIAISRRSISARSRSIGSTG